MSTLPGSSSPLLPCVLPRASWSPRSPSSRPRATPSTRRCASSPSRIPSDAPPTRLASSASVHPTERSGAALNQHCDLRCPMCHWPIFPHHSKPIHERLRHNRITRREGTESPMVGRETRGPHKRTPTRASFCSVPSRGWIPLSALPHCACKSKTSCSFISRVSSTCNIVTIYLIDGDTTSGEVARSVRRACIFLRRRGNANEHNH